MLTRAVVIGICVVSSLGSLIEGSGKGRDKVSPPKLSIHTDRATYGLSDEINIEVRVTNKGQAPILVYGELRWGFGGGLVIHLADKDGKPVEPRYLDDDSIPPGGATDAKNLVRLYPGHFLGTSRKDKVADLLGQPGHFRIAVDYLSPVSAQLVGLEGLWSSEMGPVRSDTIEVVVTGR